MVAATGRGELATASGMLADVEGEATATTGTIRALDGVRGLAILLVVWCHLDALAETHLGLRAFINSRLGPWSPVHDVAAMAGPAGVMLFFVLSGFLLFLPYARALLDGAKWPDTRTFYLRRMRRILPAYLPVLTALLIVTAAEAAARHESSGIGLLSLIAGVTLLYNHARPMFDLLAGNNSVIGNWEGPLWTLAVEWQFYLLLPWLALGFRSLARGRLRHLVGALLALVAAGLLIRAFAAWAHYSLGLGDPISGAGVLGTLCALLYGPSGMYIEVFSLGMLASLAYVWGIEGGWWVDAPRVRLMRALLVASAVLGLTGLLCAGVAGRFTLFYGPLQYWLDERTHGWLAPAIMVGDDFTCGLAATALVLGVLCRPRSLPRRLFEALPLVWLGWISYSIYLWHYPLIRIALSVASPSLLWFGAVLAVILLWSATGYRLVERPFLGRTRKRVLSALVA